MHTKPFQPITLLIIILCCLPFQQHFAKPTNKESENSEAAATRERRGKLI